MWEILDSQKKLNELVNKEIIVMSDTIKTDFVQNCLMSKKIQPSTPLLAASATFPATLDLRDLVLQTEDQGSTSTCAAHTATSWAESVNWRKYGVIKNLDPYKVYDYAKTIDGYPGVEGTTLDAVLESLLHFKMIDNTGDIFCFTDVITLKKVIHKYGPCLVAFNVSDCWMKHYGLNVLKGKPGDSCGGHAITAVGYNKAGLLIQNSWGNRWGKYGFACISWALVNEQFQYGAIIKNCLNNLN